MAVNKSNSLIMAQRLKKLRKDSKLSHESLRKAIMEEYEIDISVDSLKNYEVSSEHHAKAYKNEGMRVEYLRVLADFYGVSSDYILGRTNDSNVNPPAVDDLCISENTAKFLSELKIAENQDFARDVYLFLGNEEIQYFLYQVHLFIASKKAERIYREIREKVFNSHTEGGYKEIARNLHDEVKQIVQSDTYSADVIYTLLRQYQLDIDETSGQDIRQLVRSLYGSESTKFGSQYVTVSDVGEYFVVKSLQHLLYEVLKDGEKSSEESLKGWYNGND